MSRWRLLPLLLGLGTTVQAADILGYVRDASNGESLPFVSVYLKGESRGSITNEAGYYAIPNVPAGAHELVVSYIGYAAFTRQILLADDDLVVDVRLSWQAIELRATVIEADATDMVDIDISPSRISLRPAELKAAPAAIEADPIRTIQTLPGVKDTFTMITFKTFA